jgi:hypothetical protein
VDRVADDAPGLGQAGPVGVDAFPHGGVRPLIRPYRHAIAWNPADERCQAFRIRAHRAAHWSIHAAVAVANDPSMPTGPSVAPPADS